MSLLIYDESWLDINDLDLMREIMIVVYVHALYQTLLSNIQSIFVSFIFKYVEKLFEFNENRDSNRVCKNLNNERRLNMQSLYNDLNYHHEKLKIQFLIDWRTKSDEWEQDDNIMLLNLILKLAHYMKDLNWIFDYTLSKLFSNMLIINQEMIRLLHLSEKIIKWDFNVWKCCRKCKSFIMSKTRLN